MGSIGLLAHPNSHIRSRTFESIDPHLCSCNQLVPAMSPIHQHLPACGLAMQSTKCLGLYPSIASLHEYQHLGFPVPSMKYLHRLSTILGQRIAQEVNLQLTNHASCLIRVLLGTPAARPPVPSRRLRSSEPPWPQLVLQSSAFKVSAPTRHQLLSAVDEPTALSPHVSTYTVQYLACSFVPP